MPIQEHAQKYDEMWNEDRKFLITSLKFQKYSNRGSLRSKTKTKRKRLEIQSKVNQMEKTLNLMERKHFLKQMDIHFKQKVIEEKTKVNQFKRDLREKKAYYEWKRKIIEKKQKERGKMDRETTLKNKYDKEDRMLLHKRKLVQQKKMRYFRSVEQLQREIIDDLQEKARKAEKIRQERKKGRLKKIKFVQDKYRRTKERIKKDNLKEKLRIQKEREKAKRCIDYENKMFLELDEADDIHQKIDNEFNEIGDVPIRPKPTIMELKFAGFEQSTSKMEIFDDEELENSNDSSTDGKNNVKKETFKKKKIKVDDDWTSKMLGL